jgi:predicted DCC family thiol-disulfide oxidoreductase YuxK
MKVGHPTTRTAAMLVLYDADCGLCSRTAQALRILDTRGRLALVPLQSAAGAIDPGVPPREQLQRVLHVRDADGAWWQGGEAVMRIAASVPVLRPLALVGRLPIISGMVEPGYRALARNRDRLGRLVGAASCRFAGDPPAA